MQLLPKDKLIFIEALLRQHNIKPCLLKEAKPGFAFLFSKESSTGRLTF